MLKILISVLLIVFTTFTWAEDFAEFTGRALSPQQEENIADALMDWSVSHHVKAEQRMLPEEYSAIKRYGRVDHDVINEFLRAGEPKDFLGGLFGDAAQRSVKAIKSALNKLPNYKGTVYRGSTIKNVLLEKINVGDIFHERAFLSTSMIPSYARTFSASAAYEGASAAQFKISLKSAGRAINAYTFKAYEAEILAKPNTYYRIEAINRLSRNQNFIKLREIKNPSRYLRADPDARVYDSFSGEEVNSRRSSLMCL
ncbi:ADP-ribosyltransferase exoenzyme [Shewanella psychrophila]|uniref:ADP-ribosyltransferase exoenzyme n=1 Tax=Shewanella psychrophila TaxID=225848 RepID=A0A1S6HJG8_9GAMM|nr:ADP-ribosyltransferase [Shewanella psychrophila]AQS35660.1 ADP-ribosyltransferase exoenzyme [Shewanella psychrophila]